MWLIYFLALLVQPAGSTLDFDAFKANPKYAIATLLAAQEAGASVLVLCDTTCIPRIIVAAISS